jgi:type II secretory pathway predicted ATPase ExeA
MYAKHFALSTEPFGITPDPSYLYLSAAHREALAALRCGLLEGRGFITLVGEVGTGKTTVLYSLLNDLDDTVETAYVTYSGQTFAEFLVDILAELGVAAPRQTKHDLIAALNTHVRARADQGGTTALVIDEAQNVPDEMLEELRLLSNFESYDRKLLQIVLVGQPELEARLTEHQLRQIDRRVAVRARIAPLSQGELHDYIAHRVHRAGGSADTLFSPRALRLIWRRSRGNPREANILCHNALLFTYARNLCRVTGAVVREAVAEMDAHRPRRALRTVLRAARPREAPRWTTGLAIATAVIVAAVLLDLHSLAQRAGASVRAFGGAVLTVAPELLEPADLMAEPAAPFSEDTEPCASSALVAASTIDGRGTAGLVDRRSGGDRPTPSSEPDRQPEPKAAGEREAAALMRAVATEEQPAVVTPAPDSGEFVVRVVRPGVTLFSLARDQYGARGFDAATFLAEVRRLNPELADLNRIRAGEEVRLPAPRRTVARVLPPGGTLLGLARELFGHDLHGLNTETFFAEVKRLNPHVSDVNHIAAGTRLQLPAPPVLSRDEGVGRTP